MNNFLNTFKFTVLDKQKKTGNMKKFKASYDYLIFDRVFMLWFFS